MRIETQRCLIRNFNESDVYALYCILSSPKVMEYIEPPFTEEKSEEYWNQGIADEITKSLINFARKKLIHSLIIECDPRQNKTIKLAVRNGFKLISDKELHIYELVL